MCPAAHLLVGHSLDRAISKDSCRIDITEGTGAGVAMTVGNAVAGGTPAIQRHEDVHVMQGRILGPLYLPLLVLDCILFTIFWLSTYCDSTSTPTGGCSRRMRSAAMAAIPAHQGSPRPRLSWPADPG